MALENPTEVDAVGTERASGVVVLTLIDGWDWTDESAHLIALQTKLNAYFGFVESGQLEESYPEAQGRPRRLEIIAKHPIPPSAQRLFDQAAIISLDGLSMEVVARNHQS